MNIEEKARAYDKALERAKMYRDNAKAVEDYSAVARYENIFPELHKEEKPLTPFQQCLNCILRGVYYAEVPYKKVNEFIVNVVRARTNELIKLAKIHEYTDCQLYESEDEKMMQEFNDWLCEEIECRTSSLCDEKDRRTLNMLCYILSKVKDWPKKQKEQKDYRKLYEDIAKSEWFKKAYEGKSLGDDDEQKEQKPAWSEELNIDTLREWSMRYAPDIRQAIESTAYHFYNLRPHWKPSKEEMEALDVACSGKLWYGEIYLEGLKRIREQLKKL